MKSVTIFKQLFVAMAAITMVGCLSSCKDQSFDWDAAHANTAQEKFTEVFIREFGKPAPGHQWGFDMAWENGGQTRSVDTYYNIDGTNRDSLVIVKLEGKLDSNGNWVYQSYTSSVIPNGVAPQTSGNYSDFVNKFGDMPFITDEEHRDVYEWFSKHKVTWENTTEYIGKIGTEGESYSFTGVYVDRDGGNVSGTPKAGREFKGTVTKTTSEGTTTYDGNFIIDIGAEAEAGCIVKLVYFSNHVTSIPAGTPDTRNQETSYAVWTRETISSDNTIKPEYLHASLSDDRVEAGMHINFQHAWIQYVASSNRNEMALDSYGKIYDEKQIVTNQTLNDIECTKFNDLRIYPAAGGGGHGENYNNGRGPGYMWCTDPTVDKYAQCKGILALGANLNQLANQNSSDNTVHDKWYIVYLEGGSPGKEYAGWYLGFDLEGSGRNGSASAQYAANGICNDMIIKLVAVNPYIQEYPYNCRIMCEDLGGFNGTKIDITGGSRKLASDIDYNDVVFDVVSDNNSDNRIVYITLRAAGGTLPLTIWYKYEENNNIVEIPLFETHEFFTNGTVLSDYTLNGVKHKGGDKVDANNKSHYLTLSDYQKMYNTGERSGGSEITATARTIGIYPRKYQNAAYQPIETQIPNNDGIKYVSFGTYNPVEFKVENLEIKVWRHDTQDYLDNQTYLYDVAEWVNLTNQLDQAPLKICVPLIKWSAERLKINDATAYPNFDKWVGDSSQNFWDDSTNSTDFGNTYKGTAIQRQ